MVFMKYFKYPEKYKSLFQFLLTKYTHVKGEIGGLRSPFCSWHVPEHIKAVTCLPQYPLSPSSNSDFQLGTEPPRILPSRPMGPVLKVGDPNYAPGAVHLYGSSLYCEKPSIIRFLPVTACLMKIEKAPIILCPTNRLNVT